MLFGSHRKTTGIERFFKSDDVGISVCNVNLFYGDFQALKNINMEILPNRITSLIGPSGCGKSTLLKALNRMNDLVEGCRFEGKISIGGVDPYGATDLSLLRKNVGMVFQKSNLFPISIYENIVFSPRTFGIKKRAQLDEIVEKSLKSAAMWDEVKDRLGANALSLSGGQQQRLCIARMLAASPKVILMDEPTSALDPGSTAKIEQLLLGLRDKYTIVIVTHNMQQAIRISDQTAFFLLGEMVETGDVKQLFESPKDERTANYVGGKFG